MLTLTGEPENVTVTEVTAGGKSKIIIYRFNIRNRFTNSGNDKVVWSVANIRCPGGDLDIITNPDAKWLTGLISAATIVSRIWR